MFNNGVSRGGPAPTAPPRAAALASHDVNTAVTIELAVPLSGHQGAIGSIALRHATYGDWIDCGPIRRNVALNPADPSEMRIEVIDDRDALMRWMTRLTGQPEAILRLMSARDAFAVRREVEAIVAEFDLGNSPAALMNSPSSSG